MCIYLAKIFHGNICEKRDRSKEKAAFLLDSETCGRQSATWWLPADSAALPSSQCNTVMHDGWGVCLTHPLRPKGGASG